MYEFNQYSPNFSLLAVLHTIGVIISPSLLLFKVIRLEKIVTSDEMHPLDFFARHNMHVIFRSLALNCNFSYPEHKKLFFSTLH